MADAGAAQKPQSKCLLLAGLDPRLVEEIRNQVSEDVDVWCVQNDDTLTHEMLDVVDIALINLDRSETLAYRFANLAGDSPMHCQILVIGGRDATQDLRSRLPSLRRAPEPLQVSYLLGMLDWAKVGKAHLQKLDEEQGRVHALYEISSSLLKVTNRMHIAPALETTLPRLLDSELILLVFPADPHPIFFLHCPSGLGPHVLGCLRSHLKEAWDVLRSETELEWDWMMSLAATNDESHFKDIKPTSFITTPISSGARTEGFLTVLPRSDRNLDEIFLQTLFVIGDLISVLLHNLDLRERLEERAMHDGLTKLLNRQTLIETLEKECRRSQRYDNTICLVMMDIDHFKLVNDRYGHQAGDEVLRVVAQRLRNSIREVDVVGRCGGEEFIVVLVNTDLDGGRVWAERFREAISRNPIIFRGAPIPITASFGVATGAGPEAVVDRLIGRVDSALYEAKRSGRNRVVVSEPDWPKEFLEIDTTS